MSVIVNLFGGPGTGKSTMAAWIFSELKSKNIECELVREYVKDWAWESRKISPLNQLHFLGEQSYRESLLYDKVDAVVTDSPIILAPFYQTHYTGENYTLSAALGFMKQAKKKYNIDYLNIFLNRDKPYSPNGRYETEKEAKNIDKKLKQYLKDINMPYKAIDFSNKNEILNEVICHINTKPI